MTAYGLFGTFCQKGKLLRTSVPPLLNLGMNPRCIKHADCGSINLRVFKKIICVSKAQAPGLTLPAVTQACLFHQEIPRCRAQSRQTVASSGDKGNIINQSDRDGVLTAAPTNACFVHRISAAVGRDGCTAGVVIPCLPSCYLLSPVLLCKRSGLKMNPQLGLLARDLCGPHGLGLGFFCSFTILKSLSFSSYTPFPVVFTVLAEHLGSFYVQQRSWT